MLKRDNAKTWTRYDVVGWGQPVRHNGWAPDGRWYGNNPVAIADVRGEDAERLIPRIEAAVRDYRYRNYGDYRVWPGPNSNSFTAAILRAVPELGVALPPNAIGRDFRDGFYAGLTDSHTGVELNLWGYAGVKIGWVEGHRVQPARPRRRHRCAQSRAQAARLWPHRRLITAVGSAPSRQRSSTAATSRAARSGSLSTITAIAAPNSTLVSRNAATIAIGATVIAQIAMPYDSTCIAPPARPWRQ